VPCKVTWQGALTRALGGVTGTGHNFGMPGRKLHAELTNLAHKQATGLDRAQALMAALAAAEQPASVLATLRDLSSAWWERVVELGALGSEVRTALEPRLGPAASAPAPAEKKGAGAAKPAAKKAPAAQAGSGAPTFLENVSAAVERCRQEFDALLKADEKAAAAVGAAVAAGAAPEAKGKSAAGKAKSAAAASAELPPVVEQQLAEGAQRGRQRCQEMQERLKAQIADGVASLPAVMRHAAGHVASSALAALEARLGESAAAGDAQWTEQQRERMGNLQALKRALDALDAEAQARVAEQEAGRFSRALEALAAAEEQDLAAVQGAVTAFTAAAAPTAVQVGRVQSARAAARRAR
jgi:hypothetical protein